MDENTLLILIPSLLKMIVTVIKLLLRHKEIMCGKRDSDAIDYSIDEDIQKEM